MHRNLMTMGVGALAVLAMSLPTVSASAAPAAVPVADTSVDGIAQVAKTHAPKTEEQSFAPVADEGSDDATAPFSSEGGEDGENGNGDNQDGGDDSQDDDADTTAQAGQSVIASADLTGLATVGVTWKQSDMTNIDNAPDYQLRYFTNNAWSDWVTLPSVDADYGKMGVSPSYYVGAATKAEAKLTPKNGQTIEEAKLVTIDSGYSAAGDAQGSAYRGGEYGQHATQSATGKATSDAESDGKTVRAVAATTATGTIHTREEWWVNGNPAMDWPPERTGHWKGAIVHHTVDRNNYSQAEVPAMINGIYLYHNVHNGWGDIGYQLIVDRFGGIWEGRDEGVPNQVVPASQVAGAQSVGFNYDTFGVAMLGSYHLDVAPTDAQINSVAAAIAWEFDALGITDPYGTFQYKGTQARITGHGDQSHWAGGNLNRTACPGQQVWNRMGAIRDKVKSYLRVVSKMPKVNLANGAYYINSVAKDSSSVEIAQGDTSDGATTHLQDSGATANQQFTFTAQSDGSFEIRNVASGKVLDVADGVATDGASVRQWTANGSVAQHWFVRDSGAGYYLQSALGEYVLDLAGGATANGTVARLYSPNNTNAQKFGLASTDASIPVGKSVRVASAANGNKVLDIAGGSTANQAAVQLYDWNGSDAQLYQFKPVGKNNVFSIVNARSGKAIEAAGGQTGNGTKLQQYSSNGTVSQHWMARTAGSGAFSFFGVGSGKSFDLPGGSTANGTRVQLYTGNGSVAQQWKLTEEKTARDRLNELAAQHKSDLADGMYKVASGAKGSMVLDVAAGSKANGANVQLYSWNGSDAQIWKVSHDGTGYVTLTNVNSGKVLDVAGGSTALGANVQQYAGNGSWAQKWIAVKGSDGAVTLRSAAAENRVIDVAGGSTANGANVQLYSGNGSKAQQWKFTETKTMRGRLDDAASAHKDDVTDGVYTFASGTKQSKVLDVAAGSKANGANVQLYASNGSKAQQWRVSHDAKGYVTLTNVGSGKVLDVAGGSTANGANIQQYAGNGSWAQKWIAVKHDDGTVTLRSAAAEGKVIDVAAGSTANGANVQLYASNGSKAQRWVSKQ